MIQGTLDEGTAGPDDRADARDAAHDPPVRAGGARGARGTAGGASGPWPATRDHVGAVLIRHASPDELADLEKRGIARRDPAPIPRRVVDRARVESWGDFLAPHFATGACCNLTGTYSDSYGYSHGLMLARNVIKDFRAFCRSAGGSDVAACLGVERHPSGRDVLHFHSMLGGSWSAQELADLERLWVGRRGWAKAKQVTDREGCVEYAAKHLLKQGAEDHFEFWLPGAIYGSRYERRRATRPSMPDLRDMTIDSRESLSDGSGSLVGLARS